MVSIITNPVVLGLLVIVITKIARWLKWPVEGIKAMWLTMVIAFIGALVERVLSGGLPSFLVCELALEPVGFLTCLLKIIQAILEEFGVIFVAAEIIYQALRREYIGGRSILGGERAIIADIL